jgi:acyl carrier protein
MDCDMTRDEVIAKLIPIMMSVFDEDNIAYSDALAADDIAEWDSLSHIRFMVAVENAFGIRFATGDIENFQNVGELVSAIVSRTAA